MSAKKIISIICPIHNEELSLPIFFARIKAVILPLQERYKFELIFTNNASSDSSLAIVQQFRETHPWVNVITFSRNFGYQASLTAGIRHAVGDAIVIIDVDCEDPPELIPEFLEHWEEGNDIVYGERKRRVEPQILQLMRKAFYRVTRRIADAEFILDMAEFSLFTRRVGDSIVANNSTDCFIRSEIAYAGFRRCAVPYNRQPRVAGETHYNILGMFEFAIASIMTASTFPLRAIAYAGAPMLCIDFLMLVFWLITGSAPFAAALFLANGMVLVMASVTIGIYVARIYNNQVGRPLYIIDEQLTQLNRPVVQVYLAR